MVSYSFDRHGVLAHALRTKKLLLAAAAESESWAFLTVVWLLSMQLRGSSRRRASYRSRSPQKIRLEYWGKGPR